MEIGFYHLTRSRAEDALPRLLEKILAAGYRAVVCVPDRERLEQLDRHLWTYSRDSFLPHGTRSDGHAARQPVLLTDRIENPNAASVLVLLDIDAYGELEGFERVIDMFDGSDPEALAAARARWQQAKRAGHELAYWQQDERGAWKRAR